MENYPIYDYIEDNEFDKIIKKIENIPLKKNNMLPSIPNRELNNSFNKQPLLNPISSN
jgi:hypothetical protein